MTRSSLIPLLCAAFAVNMASCGGSGTGVVQTFALYRNSVTDENMRINVATFDATDGEAYNRGNCEQANCCFKRSQA